MRYFTNAAGGLVSIDATDVVSRYTAIHGWVPAPACHGDRGSLKWRIFSSSDAWSIWLMDAPWLLQHSGRSPEQTGEHPKWQRKQEN
jgi:hypothetical protein